MTITTAQRAAIAQFVRTHRISRGLGTPESCCGQAAINFVLSGELKDTIPDDQSEVIGRWYIKIQDAMPDYMRNSDEWKELIPLMAGTGREHERERADIALAHMWDTVLPQLLPLADAKGFGDAWRTMLRERTPKAATALFNTPLCGNSDMSSSVAPTLAVACRAAKATNLPTAAFYAADAARVAVKIAIGADADFWHAINPADCLRRMIAAGGAA